MNFAFFADPVFWLCLVIGVVGIVPRARHLAARQTSAGEGVKAGPLATLSLLLPTFALLFVMIRTRNPVAGGLLVLLFVVALVLLSRRFAGR